MVLIEFIIGDDFGMRYWEAMLKPVAIIPARGGSKRLPRKNILPFADAPMISWPIRACQNANLFDQVIVSTEDEEIADIARQYGAEVAIRPPEMATDEIHEGMALNQVLDTLASEGKEPEHFLVIYATAVLVEAEDLQQSFKLTTDADAVMSMSEYIYHPYKAFVLGPDGYWGPLFPKESKMQTQTYPKALAVNGTFCWLRRSVWRTNMHYFPERFQCYQMDADRAVDVDTPEDYLLLCRKLESPNIGAKDLASSS